MESFTIPAYPAEDEPAFRARMQTLITRLRGAGLRVTRVAIRRGVAGWCCEVVAVPLPPRRRGG